MDQRPDRINAAPPVWEYAVLVVDVVLVPHPDSNGRPLKPGERPLPSTSEQRAWASVDGTVIYNRTLDAWDVSGPLADLGRDGWELVSHQAYPRPERSQVPMTFFLKRPRLAD